MIAALGACDPNDSEPDAAIEANVCAGDSECQDGSYCNGWEICDPSNRYADEQGCLRGVACAVVRNVRRRVELLDGDESSPAYRDCSEDLYELGIFMTCSAREGNPLPSRNTMLDDRVCADPQEGDYQSQCHAWADWYCTADRDCDDGVFCNGAERCMPISTGADARGCLSEDESPCGDEMTCDEAADECRLDCDDDDGDGHFDARCGGDDCDDGDDGVFPGAPELCNDVDEDCDPATVGARDLDQDGFVSSDCSNPDGDETIRGPDCDDDSPRVHPIAPEVCNGIDEDCNGVIDDALLIPMYPDTDGDGFGEGDKPSASVCAGTPGHSPIDGDCAPENPQLFPGSIRCVDLGPNQPGAIEVCEGGAWQAASCGNSETCYPQPTGAGVCLPL